MITKPMLAAQLDDLSLIKYPVLATPKIDGIRCLIVNGEPLTRSFKPIPNRYVYERLKKDFCNFSDTLVDGELTCGDFQETTSSIMSIDGEPVFTYHVFDYLNGGKCINYTYAVRAWGLDAFRRYIERYMSGIDYINILSPHRLGCEQELLEYEEYMLSIGYEGIIIRSPDSPYKCGRSTIKEGGMLKIKRFKDSEAVILDVIELSKNTNDIVIDGTGNKHRLTHKDKMLPYDTTGSLLVKDKYTEQIFNVGSGLDNKLRDEIWLNKSEYIGKTIKYKYFAVGVKDLPRFPVFLGFRSELDGDK